MRVDVVDRLSSWVLLVLGLFLVADKLFFGLITFAYPEWIAWVDGFFGHGLLGLAFVVIAVLGLRRK